MAGIQFLAQECPYVTGKAIKKNFFLELFDRYNSSYSLVTKAAFNLNVQCYACYQFLEVVEC